MLFYVRCPSCGRILSRNIDKYYEDSEKILTDPLLSSAEKNVEGSKLLDKYGYRMICCRIRIMGLIPYHKIIST